MTPWHNVNTPVSALVVTALAAATLAACSSSGSGSPGSASSRAGSTGPHSADGTTSAAAPTASSGSGSALLKSSVPKTSGSGPIKVCDAIPVAAVNQVTGRTVYKTAHEMDGPSAGAHVYACEYTDSAKAGDALDGFNVVVYRGGNTAKIMRTLAGLLTSGAKPQTGIGDTAQLGDGELDVVVGGDVVVVSDAVHEGDLAELSLPQLETLAKQIMAKL